MNNKTDTISTHGSLGSRGIHSISINEEMKYDTVPYRLDFIKNILKDNTLEPIINFNDLDTEQFIHPNGYSSVKDNNESDDSNDVRTILNKKKHDFYDIISTIGGKLRYVKSGAAGHTFQGIITADNGVTINYAVKVVAYPKRERYGGMNDVRRPENAELMMIKLLSYFIVREQTPHIALPIGTFYTSITPFVNLIEEGFVDKDNKKYMEFVNRYKKKDYYDTVSILISEWANRGDFLEFLKQHYKEFSLLHWKVFFFQIISVLAVIQSKFPGFRHNDYKGNNILVHRIENRCKKFSYTVCKYKYRVPNIGYVIKMWDFDFASIPGIVENAKVTAPWTDRINVKPVQNRYYDIHYFFNSLITPGFFPELMKDPTISNEVKQFVNRIVPEKYRHTNTNFIAERGRILVNDEYIIPDEILRTDPFFEEFRAKKPVVNRKPNSSK